MWNSTQLLKNKLANVNEIKGHNAKQNCSEEERQIPDDFTYICGIYGNKIMDQRKPNQ